MAGMITRLHTQDIQVEDDDEPPPDMLAECDSDETILAVQNALAERYEVIPIESDEHAYERLKSTHPHLVFNIAERIFGPNREAHIPSLCEILNLPYTGSDPLTLSLCLDKSRAKEILTYYNIPNARFWTIETPDDLPAEIPFPVIVKPMYEGSSKGIKDNSVVYSKNELRDRVQEVLSLYKQPVIVEQFLSGREFTVGILGNHPDLHVLPIVEIDHTKLPNGAAPIYSYEAKWIWDVPDQPLEIFQCPADITQSLKNEIDALVGKVCRILRIKDWGRIDVRLDESGQAHILEINPLPGILPNPEDNSCLPKAARTAGLSYSQMILTVVDAAKLRYGMTS
jgi:D-alanine-D-alanine ligase